MLKEMKKRTSGSTSMKTARAFVRLFCPFMEGQDSYQFRKDILLPVKFFINGVPLFFEVTPAELLGVEKPRQIKSFDQHSSRVPPVPEAQGVMDAPLPYRPDRREPLFREPPLD